MSNQAIHRHTLTVRIAHWVNVLCLTVLLMSGLQIFNAHPALYIGKQSDFDHPILSIAAEERNARLVGVTNLAGTSFTTTGILMPTPAFPHDHVMPYSARHIEIEGKEYPYFDQLVWPEIATTPGLPATAVPIGGSETGLPIGVRIVGPYLEDRTTIAFAELMEREFGGFVPPLGYAG